MFINNPPLPVVSPAPASVGNFPEFPSEWKLRPWQWKLAARIFDDGRLSSSLLSFISSALLINQHIHSVPSVPGDNFSCRNTRRCLSFGAGLEVSMVTQGIDIFSGEERGRVQNL